MSECPIRPSRPCGLDGLFPSASDWDAYEAFCAEQERAAAEKFALAEPALVCRWRMVDKRVPLLNRHIRALAARRVSGKPLTRNMLSWAKQHVEWSLAEGSYADASGVLMLVVDVDGNAAMTVGAYEPLARMDAAALVARAEAARAEQGETGVAPEALVCAANGRLLVAAKPGEAPCGALSLVEQLARTRGFAVERVGGDPAALAVRAGGSGTGAGSGAPASCGVSSDGVLPSDATRPASALLGRGVLALVSDEHGIVVAEEGRRAVRVAVASDPATGAASAVAPAVPVAAPDSAVPAARSAPAAPAVAPAPAPHGAAAPDPATRFVLGLPDDFAKLFRPRR